VERCAHAAVEFPGCGLTVIAIDWIVCHSHLCVVL
jgi:hypothetical protein